MLLRKEISQQEASRSLNLTTRQVRNKLGSYKKDGPKSLIHKNRGKPSNKRWDKEAEAIKFIKDELAALEVGPTYASEQLEQRNIHVGIETVR